MAVKSNTAVVLDRQMIGDYHTLACALSSELTEIRDRTRGPIAYLLAEENISGGDAVDFKDGLTSMVAALDVCQKKISVIQQAAGVLNERYGDLAGQKRRTLKEARAAMTQTLMKAKTVGK